MGLQRRKIEHKDDRVTKEGKHVNLSNYKIPKQLIFVQRMYNIWRHTLWTRFLFLSFVILEHRLTLSSLASTDL